MDFELFQLEDDEILSLVCVPQSDELDIENDPFPAFNCTGEDNQNSTFHPNSFIKNKYLYSSKHNSSLLKKITPHEFPGNSIVVNTIYEYAIRQIRMYIQTLFVNSKVIQYVETDVSNYIMRREVTNFLFSLRCTIDEIPKTKLEKDLKMLRSFFNTIITVDTLKFFSNANSPRGNETESPSYHFLHGYLEWQLIQLMILSEIELSTCDNSPLENTNESLEFDSYYCVILENLVIMSIALFNKRKLPQYPTTSPFPCTCVKEMWLLLQLIREKCDPCTDFWTYFNDAMNKIKERPEIYGLQPKHWPMFTAWLLKGVVQLQGYETNGSFEGPLCCRVKPNFEFLESLTRSFVETNLQEEKLRVFLNIISTIILEWWQPKVETPMILWEYFYKKINTAFYITSTAPSHLAVIRSYARNYIEEVKKFQLKAEFSLDQTSYSMFLTILAKTNERLAVANQNNQLQKIFGRIYSKFSSSKILAYNEIGIHNLVELFLTLALTCDLKDIAPKLRDKLLSISLTSLTAGKQICLMKGHMALMILCIESNINIADYVNQVLSQIKGSKNDLSVMRILAENLPDVLKTTNAFLLGEERLIDSWIASYISFGSSMEQERLLATLHELFESIMQHNTLGLHNDKPTENFLNSVTTYILPFVKQKFSSTFFTHLPLLAADFCILLPTSRNSNESLRLFKFFIDASCVDKQTQPKFLLAILKSNKSSLADNDTIFRTWLKSLVLLTANNEDVVNLMQHVTSMNDFHMVCGLQNEELISSKEPLCVFVSAVGKTYSQCKDFAKKSRIADKINGYLVNFDKWILDKNEKAEILFRYYSFIAIMIFNCSSIVYTRSKISCFFHVAISRFILPNTLQIGKAPDQKLAQMVHKVWPVIVQGIGNLDFKTDSYLNNQLSDLVLKWTPHFRISSNTQVVAKPFVACMACDNEALQIFILEKLATSFLTTQRRQADPNSCLVLTIFSEIIEGIKDDPKKLKIFVQTVTTTLLEHIIMVDSIVPSRKIILDLLKCISVSSAFRNHSEISEIFLNHLKQITIKHLSYQTFFYFDMLMSIVLIFPDSVESLMNFLKEQITIVERKRGSGQDASIRGLLEKLNGALLAVKRK